MESPENLRAGAVETPPVVESRGEAESDEVQRYSVPPSLDPSETSERELSCRGSLGR